MSLNDIRRQLYAEAEKTMGKEYIEYARKDNSKKVRDKLIAMNHYFHILNLLGDTKLDEGQAFVYFDLAREKIANIRDRELQQTELLKLNILSVHTSAWNIAHYHYERAIKTLCMMKVTLMDHIIMEQGGQSVLYGADESEYFDVAEEIAALNGEYRSDYISICAFDFCTKKLGEYMDIPEYSDIAREHSRVINNGNPQRVQSIIDRLKKFCTDSQPDIFLKIQNAYTPEPLYSEELFAQCYAAALCHYRTEENAMEDFNGLVSRVSADYLDRLNKS